MSVSTHVRAHLCVCVCACVCVCLRACVRARASTLACVCVFLQANSRVCQCGFSSESQNKWLKSELFFLPFPVRYDCR